MANKRMKQFNTTAVCIPTKHYMVDIKGENQILECLDTYGLDTGYMLSFNLNKSKTPGVGRVEISGEVVFEGMV